MLTALAALVLSSWSATPSADVWVYPHSSDPGGEAFMRVWGDGTAAIDKTLPPADSFSYGYLQFELKDLPKGDLKGAKLVVWNISNKELTEEILKASPLEVFGLKGTFKEASFDAGGSTVGPVEPSLGKSKAEIAEQGIRLEIDLNDEKGEFKKLLDAARRSGTLGLALASKITPEDSRGTIYKVNSKEGPEKVRPTLTLEFSD